MKIPAEAVRARRKVRQELRCSPCREGNHMCCAGFRDSTVDGGGAKIYRACYCECAGALRAQDSARLRPTTSVVSSSSAPAVGPVPGKEK